MLEDVTAPFCAELEGRPAAAARRSKLSAWFRVCDYDLPPQQSYRAATCGSCCCNDAQAPANMQNPALKAGLFIKLSSEFAPSRSHISESVRSLRVLSEAISACRVQDQASSKVDAALEGPGSALQRLAQLLTGQRLAAAISLASASGDIRLATLICQVASLATSIETCISVAPCGRSHIGIDKSVVIMQ